MCCWVYSSGPLVLQRWSAILSCILGYWSSQHLPIAIFADAEDMVSSWLWFLHGSTPHCFLDPPAQLAGV